MKMTLLAALLAVPALALAQGGPPPGRRPGASRMYDPATVETVSGTVVVENRVDRGRGHAGVHVRLRTAGGEIAVHLGPDFFVDQQGLRLAPGDAVTVTGSRVGFGGKPAIIARSVTKGGQVLALRDAAGEPAWSGRGAR